MNDLRLILLGIGLFIIAVIYLWETFKQKAEDRSHTRKITSFKRDSFIDAGGMPIDDIDDRASAETLAEADAFLANHEFPYINTSETPLKTKMEEIDEQEIKLSRSIPNRSADLDTQQTSDDQIITFLIKSSLDKEFSGIDILKATEAVGLKFGEMKIFHHHGVEGMETTEAIFSLANMYEPGYFDLDKMEDYKTKGLALFMQLPTPIDSMPAFDLIQETAIKLSDMLEGEVWSSKHKVIDEEALLAMRDMIVKSS